MAGNGHTLIVGKMEMQRIFLYRVMFFSKLSH